MSPRSPGRHLQQTAFLVLDARKCRACWRCIDACPKHIIGRVSVLWHKHVVLRGGGDCIGCFLCIAGCGAGALQRKVAA